MRKPSVRAGKGPRSGAILLVALAVGALTQCSRTPAEEISPSQPSPAPQVARDLVPTGSSGGSASVDGSARTASGSPLRWDDPPRWVRRAASSPMRVAEYRVPAAPGDAGDGECTVITFGSAQGGGVDENVGRWVRQFSPTSATPTQSTTQADGMTVTRVEVAGTYHPMRMPGAPGAAVEPGARLVGAIVEAPSGLWFFKLTGPDATVRAAAHEIDRMVASVRKN